MMDDEYEILPHNEVLKLRKELDEIKKHPGEVQVSTLDTVNRNLTELLSLFKEAAENIELEGREKSDIQEHLGPINEKLEEVLDQNKKIAEGVVALSDMIASLEENIQNLSDQMEDIKDSQQSRPPPYAPQRPSLRPFSQGPAQPPGMPPFEPEQ
jgi:chromosome segregation ATPase